MSNNLLFSVLILFSLVLLTACEPEFIPADDASIEMDFFPIDSFTTWEYRMDSIIYDNEGLTIDTSVSYRREQVLGSFMDIEGKVTYRLGIAKKSNLTDIYKETDLWTFQLNENGLQRKEENLNFVKLLFPIVIGDFWDGNQFPENTEIYVAGDAIEAYRRWEYEYVDRLESFAVGAELYTDVIHVKQADNTNEIERRFSEEYYAKGVGLISRNMEILDHQCGVLETNCDTKPWVEKADQGFILSQRLIRVY